MTRICVIEHGRLRMNGEVLPIRKSIVLAGLAVYAARTGKCLWPKLGARPIPSEAADEILLIERRSSLALLELSFEESLTAA